MTAGTFYASLSNGDVHTCRCENLEEWMDNSAKHWQATTSVSFAVAVFEKKQPALQFVPDELNVRLHGCGTLHFLPSFLQRL